jgi:tetratricopeptide (TPR) repeat protein
MTSELMHAAGTVEESRRLLAWGACLSLDLCAYWVALGTQYESLAEERAALVAMRRAVEVDASNVAARIALGWLFAARGLPREAIVEMETAARLAPGYADVRYQLGLLYTEIGRTEAAETELRAALDVQPKYHLAGLALGCLLESLGRNAEALELLQGVRRAGIHSADLEMHLATLHARLGHRNQARRAQARARASSRGNVQTQVREPKTSD